MAAPWGGRRPGGASETLSDQDGRRRPPQGVITLGRSP